MTTPIRAQGSTIQHASVEVEWPHLK